jgi:LmbE family N-acetylglucosaminyl deacetylase
MNAHRTTADRPRPSGRKTLLGIWAHPDDEAYLSAGLMAVARQRGDRVVVVTATAGELGTDDPDRWPPARLGALRRHELRASLATLGVHEHQVLGFADGGCHRKDGTALVAAMIRAVDPDTIVTFGPDGMTGHPDHRAVSAWTTAAWRETATGARLWYATVTPRFHQTWSAVNDDIGLWADSEQPPSVDPADLSCSLELPDALLDQKLAALRAHASQTAPLLARLGEDTYRSWWRTESFVDAAVHTTLETRGAKHAA